MELIKLVALPVSCGILLLALRASGDWLARRGYAPWLDSATARTFGSLAFLSVQLVLIYSYAYAPLPALAIVVGLLTLLGFGAKYGVHGKSGMTRLGLAAFIAFLAYWAFSKYVLPFHQFNWLVNLFHYEAKPASAAAYLTMVGVSYIGFKLVSFWFDVRSRQIKSVSVTEFISWLLFFPSVVAGPMQRYEDWQEQRRAPHLTLQDAADGSFRIVLGLVMKIAVADSIYNLTLPAMTNGSLAEAPFGLIVLAACIYTIYLYFDFAGYSNMAIGIGTFWGVRLPENFNHPFVSRDLAEFWNRWHISLSTIFREYIFFPISLALKRSPRFRKRPVLSAILPSMITFLIVGIWHGAGLNFIVMGLLHGIGMSVVTLARLRKPASDFEKWWRVSLVGHVVGATLTFLYVTLTLVFFSLPLDRLAILFGS
jgi:D-alanyl-lipoteichoic acid acyltransferase DltB (MBOAT superfamily)